MEYNGSWTKEEEYEERERALGVSGMMKDFVGQTKFTGKYQ